MVIASDDCAYLVWQENAGLSVTPKQQTAHAREVLTGATDSWHSQAVQLDALFWVASIPGAAVYKQLSCVAHIHSIQSSIESVTLRKEATSCMKLTSLEKYSELYTCWGSRWEPLDASSGSPLDSIHVTNQLPSKAASVQSCCTKLC